MNPLEKIDKKILREVIWIWGGVILLIHALSALQNTSSTLLQILGSLSAIVLIYPPVLLAMFQKKNIPYWQINIKVLRLSLKWFALVSVVIFPVAVMINQAYQAWVWGAGYHRATTQIWLSYGATQLFLVAFPEEFFFRGYMQGRLAEIWPTSKKMFGTVFGFPQIATSLVFAISHSLITVQWWHIFIFFPALVFAWLKEKTGTIWASVLFHAVANVFSFWVAASYG